MNSTVTLDDVAGRLQHVTRHGKYLKASCPLHGQDAHPSLLVYADGARCLAGCGYITLERLLHVLEGGAWISDKPAAHLAPVDWSETDPAEFAHVAHRTLLNHWRQGDYLKRRGIESLIRPHKLGWYDGWYTFPVLEPEECRIVSVVLRADSAMQAHTGQRYLTPPGAPLPYVPLWGALDRSECIYIVFGVIDALVLAMHRFAVLASTHGQLVRAEWLSPYRKRIIVVPDRNEEGRARELAAQFGWRGRVGLLDYPDKLKDPADYEQAGKANLLIRQLKEMQR